MKKNNKFSIRKYSVGVVSVIIGLFILAGVNSDDRVYAASNEAVPPIVSTVPEGGNPDGVDKIVDGNNEIVDKGDLSKVPTPVTPGYFALEKEAPKVAATPDEIEKEVDIDLVELGEIKYRDVRTKEIVAEKLYDNDQTDATRAGLTILPDLPKGYRFVNKGLDRVETREVVVHKFLEQPYVSEEVGIRVKLQEVDGKLAVDPNINIEADKFAPGHNLVFDVEKYINDVEKATKQVVKFVGAEGKAPKTNVQDDYKFLGEYNDETKETTWKEKTHTYSSVDVPVVEKYFADKKQAGGREVTPEKPEVTDTVTYKHLGKILPVDEKGNPIEKAATPDYLNDLTDSTKALETPVPEIKGYVATVKSVLPKDPEVDTKVVYKKEEKPKVPQTPKEQPKTPEKPKTPEVPKVPQPKVPEKPKTPEVPKVPQTKVPEKPVTSDTPKLEEKPTPEVHKKEDVKLPNTGEKEAETAALGMLTLLLAGVLKTKKN